MGHFKIAPSGRHLFVKLESPMNLLCLSDRFEENTVSVIRL